MRFLAIVLMLCLAGCAEPTTPKQVATTPAPKPEPTNAEKIIGVWEVAKNADPNVPVGATIEFTKDGKMIMTVTAGGQTVQLPENYRVEGDTLSYLDRKVDQKIKKLTDKELVTDNGMGKIEEFKKK